MESKVLGLGKSAADHQAQMEMARRVGSEDPEHGKKIIKALQTAKVRTIHLWDPDKVEGRDYVTCPLTGTRRVMIKSTFYKNILGLSEEEYFALCGGRFKTEATSRQEVLGASLSKVDPETGLSARKRAAIKARETLTAVDPETGLTGDQKRANKTKATHMANVDETGRNGYSQLASRAIIKGNQTKRDRGLILSEEERDDCKRYRLLVLYLTNRHKHLFSDYQLGLCGVDGAHQIDHRFSITEGFKQRVSPLVIAHPKNLQILPWRENLVKHGSCSVDLNTLLDECQYTAEQNAIEGEAFMKILDELKDQSVSAGILLERLYRDANISQEREIPDTDT